MDVAPKPAKVAIYRLTTAMAEKRIKALAAKTENIGWGFHALERMDERGIYDVDVLRVLREGACLGEPEPTLQQEWKTKMVRKMRGAREVGVVVIILRPNRLFVKTVEWEDTK